MAKDLIEGDAEWLAQKFLETQRRLDELMARLWDMPLPQPKAKKLETIH